MSTSGGPGQGITLALSSDTTISRLRSLQLPELSSEPVDFTGLSDLNYFQFLAASLSDGGVLVAEMYFNSEIDRPNLRVVQNATVTFAKQTPGSTAGATLTGSGFVIGVGMPTAITGEPLIETLTFKFDGVGTPPTFTKEQ